MSELGRSDAFEVLGSDLKLTTVVLITDANRHDLATVDSKRAAIFDHDAASLATSHSEHDLVTYL